MRARFQHVHFVGIGGIGMCGIAEVLLNLDHRVSGSDLRRTATTERLERLGAAVSLGHDEAHVSDADVVVISSAVASDNPEVRRANALGIPVIPRAEMLAELMRLKDGIAIGGAHGKTTTTSLTATLLTEAGLDPTAVIGGRVRTFDSTSRLGKSDLLVAEADESDRSFLMLSPVIAVATNIDREHMEQYRDFADLVSAFESFLNKVPFWGAAIICADDPHLAALRPQLRRRTISYGFSEDADVGARDYRTKDGASRFVLCHDGQELGEITLHLPGRHNVLNALAAATIALELGVSFETIASALSRFEGVDRRMEVKGEVGGVLVVDDYGHHPTEIKATLQALREAHDGRRIICVFEPHRYSRTADLRAEFAAAFGDADRVLVTDIYAASESPIEGIDGKNLAAEIARSGHRDVSYAGSVDEAATSAATEAATGDLLLTLGAGSITHAGSSILELLAKR